MRRLFILYVFCCLAVRAAAQAPGQIVVTMLDPTEQAVPGVSVTVEQNGSARMSLITDGSGRATSAVLAAGTYKLGATLEGFTDAAPVTVRVVGNQPTRATLRLGLPRVSDSVTVAGGADTPSTETAVQTD